MVIVLLIDLSLMVIVLLIDLKFNGYCSINRFKV